MLYLDASAFVPLYAPEQKSVDVTAIVTRGEVVAVSVWSCLEAMSAFALKTRTGVLSVAQAQLIGQQMWSDATVAYTLVDVENGDLLAARRFLEAGGPPLRAGDSLHLAIAQRLNAQLVTLDRALMRAAGHWSVAAIAP